MEALQTTPVNFLKGFMKNSLDVFAALLQYHSQFTEVLRKMAY